MSEELNNNGLIDTEYERSILEYRPSFTYEPKKEITVTYETKVEVDIAPEKEEGGETYLPLTKPGEIYDEFVQSFEKVEEVIQEVESTISTMEITIPETECERLFDSAGDLKDLEDGIITFPIYDKSFDDPEHPTNSLIQDIVHSYAEGTEGSLELEFYEDLREIKQNLQEGYFLFKELILNKFVDRELMPKTPIQDNEFVKKLDEAVLERASQIENTKQRHNEAENKYYELLRLDYGSTNFFEAQKLYTESKRPYEINRRDDKQLAETMDLVRSLVQGSNICVSNMKTGLVLGSNIYEKGVKTLVENQKEDELQFKEFTKLLTLSLKLQMNNQIEEKKNYRDVLKNINSSSRKERAGNELLTAFELREKMYLNMFDSLQYLSSPSKSRGVEVFLDQVAGGLAFVEKEYASFRQDIYQMYAMDNEVRLEKIKLTIDKNDARAGYRLIKES